MTKIFLLHQWKGCYRDGDYKILCSSFVQSLLAETPDEIQVKVSSQAFAGSKRVKIKQPQLGFGLTEDYATVRNFKGTTQRSRYLLYASVVRTLIKNGFNVTKPLYFQIL